MIFWEKLFVVAVTFMLLKYMFYVYEAEWWTSKEGRTFLATLNEHYSMIRDLQSSLRPGYANVFVALVHGQVLYGSRQ